MINLHFKIDPVLIAWQIINTVYQQGRAAYRDDFNAKAVQAFIEEAHKLDAKTYKLVSQGIDMNCVVDRQFVEKARLSENFLQKLPELPSFAAVQAECLHTLNLVREEWEGNLARTFSMLTEMTGLKLDKDMDVYITHPALRNGINLDGRIFWTYRLDFANYNTVYIWHEIMHSFIYSIEDDKQTRGVAEHAVIQLLTDNELRVRLNGGSYPPLLGHAETVDLMTRLLPAWRTYLAEPDKKIETMIKVANEKETQTPNT